MLKIEPVVPVVNRITEDLGDERWSFAVNYIQQFQTHQFSASYTLDIRQPVTIEEVGFCLVPMLPPPPDVSLLDLPSSEDITNCKFYFFARDTQNQCPKRANGATRPLHKEASFAFSIDPTAVNKARFPNWNGMFFGYTYVPQGPNSNEPEFLHHFVFATDPNNAQAPIKCYIFGSNEDFQKVADDLAVFAQADPARRDELAQRCPTG